MQIAMIGLGRMGANMVRRLLKGGHQCVVFDRSPEAIEELVKVGAIGATSLADLVKKMTKPRAIWLMVPVALVDELITDILPHLEPGDVLVDGGNSYYVDDIRRAKDLAARRIQYIDCGTSGGVMGLERGYCLDDRRAERCRAASRAGFQDTGARASVASREHRGGTRSAAPPSKDICTAGRAAPAISSRWSTTASSTASWRRTPKE